MANATGRNATGQAWGIAARLRGTLSHLRAGLARLFSRRAAPTRDELERVRRMMLEESAARDRMLAFISHELRTPLHGIIGLTGLLRNTPLNAEQLNYVQSLDASGRLALSMVDELLEKARANALGAADAKAPAVAQPFDPVRTVENIAEMLAPRAHARGLELACFIAPAVRGEWLGDELRLRQILLNLVGNAIKFTREGGVLISLDRHAAGLSLTVEDTGPGVPAEVRERLFTPFARDAAQDVAQEGGAGLGLAIVRQLLGSMGGTLHLDSTPGKGTTFRVGLPSRPVREEDAEAACSPKGDESGGGLDGVVLWVVAPEGPARQGLVRYIEAHGGRARMALPEDLHDLLCDPTCEIIVDGRHADALRAALYRLRTDAPRARAWLLLTPEERLRLHDLMQDGRIHGYLLRPLRRRTFVERLVRGQTPERLARSVASLRDLSRRARDRANGGGSPGPLVLLAEDNPVNAQIARAILSRAGYRVWWVDDGRLVLEWMKQALRGELERPACILMDVHMSEMDGLEATEALRRLERSQRARPVPVLALSAGVEDGERQRCLAAGMDGFLPKPFDPDELLAAVRDIRPASGTFTPVEGG